eukprot:jgi/Phyca11/103516/e_gw1.8.476.1
MAQVAVDVAAKRIAPNVSRLMCVAYGDWSRRKGITGHAPSPVKGLKQALQKRATVVPMDEFKTSKLCSQCHQTLSQTCYGVLRCGHKNCTAQYWDRYVNAAINMVELLKSETLGRGRMPAFGRS